MSTYRIRPTRDGRFDLLQDGDWLGTFDTEAEAEAERDHRIACDKSRAGGVACKTCDDMTFIVDGHGERACPDCQPTMAEEEARERRAGF